MKRKTQLRRTAMARRDALSPDEIRRKSAAVGSHLLELPEFQRARTVMLFVSFGSEIDTLPIIEQALRNGKRVAAPRVDRLTRALIPCLITDQANDLAPGAYGIREPQGHCPPVPIDEIDVVIVPAVVWGEDGYRVGYGGGYYDRFLARVPHAVWIGLGFEMQVESDVPHESTDLKVDMLVTESQIRRFDDRRQCREGMQDDGEGPDSTD